jgi:hypothetical protein
VISAFAKPVPTPARTTATATCRCGQVVTATGVGRLQAKRHAKAKLDLHRYHCTQTREQRLGDEVI